LHLEQQRLIAIEGQVPDPMAPVAGCRFHPRCPFAVEQCRSAEPPLAAVKGAGAGHRAACWEAPLDVAALGAA
jgi:oligopeptide/dipeptide ABC transporter ATP-binding protein